MNKEGKLRLVPPQWYTLNELQKYSTLDDFIKYNLISLIFTPRLPHNDLSFRTLSHRKIQPIQPEFVSDDQGRTVCALPGDPLHPSGAVQSNDRHRFYVKFHQKGIMDLSLEDTIGASSKL